MKFKVMDQLFIFPYSAVFHNFFFLRGTVSLKPTLIWRKGMVHLSEGFGSHGVGYLYGTNLLFSNFTNSLRRTMFPKNFTVVVPGLICHQNNVIFLVHVSIHIIKNARSTNN